ncbi:4Fe-4S dicluster domain-containing protein [Candidatus Kuenenia sp.]|uniref:4Fe-4S dicluster domain-containing protein n=1 Tax=Candidatus Kuenenia sp. TaxID=2499824 RepID=UPI003220555F
MTLVHNWHLGRRMEYPYFESRPKHQFAAVFNINRCIACQTCTMACKSTWSFNKGQEYMWWNNVETKPYGGFPQSWDVKTLKLIDSPDNIWYTDDKDKETSQYGTGAPYGTYEGDTIFEVAKKKNINQWAVGYIPEDKEWRAPNFGEDTAKSSNQPGEYSTLPEHSRWFFYLQRICNHCTYPGCLAACPRKAIYKRKEDGIVLIDQKRCRGYRKCVEQCPYKKPMYRGLTRVSEKCIACYPRIEGRDPLTGGRPMETRCMSACVGQIRLQGFLDDNPKNPITWLIRHHKIALPLYPQFGTEPNVYYIPPRWAPRAYLRQMFGPGVDEAIEKFMVPSRELLAVMSLFRMTQTIVYEYKIEEGPKVFETEIHGKKFTMYNDTVIGFGEDGKEVVRTTVEEPVHIRPDKHYNSI